MKALILVGGYGTRLRPLTFSKPKPLIEFANKPILWYQVKALVEVGVTEVIMATSYQPECMLNYMKELEAEFSIKITASIENEPLGTAGPIKLAKEKLLADPTQEDFFVFNSDIICQFPLKKLLEFHKARKAEGTLMVTQVEDPSRYGVILFDETGLIQNFIEKPKKFISDKINAGLYLLNKSIIERIPDRPTSIEREVFPKVAADKRLYALVLEGIW
jgi:mannose-1-phosphate guanylyltransferase